METITTITASLLLLVLTASGCFDTGDEPVAPDTPALSVPLGGNTWKSGEGGGQVDKEGITGWTDQGVTFTTYVRISQPGSLKAWLELQVPEGESRIRVTVSGSSVETAVQGAQAKDHEVGEWELSDMGYVAFTFEGLSKEGSRFADIAALKLSGTAAEGPVHYVENDEDNFFYWGRRGPSVHLNYQVPDDPDVEWFYNEVTVPEGEDVVGSYFMANGFAEGYFGIQVNSPSERRVLFSVWSPFETDDPDEIPEEQRIILLAKGDGVYTGEFGNEGSGGQSYLKYNWKAGEAYRFLLRGRPDGTGHTIYTAWFYPPEEGEWRLIASFKRPQTSTWLKRLYSFLENFSPEQGDLERKVLFGNQWIRDTGGSWTELNRAQFTADNTARTGFRLDYGGGAEDAYFYLRNCGFFSDYTPIDTWFERPLSGTEPVIELDALP